MPKKSKKNDMQFITERVSKAGTHSYQVCIRKFGQEFRKSVNINDFDSPKQALEFARKLRNETLVKMEQGYTVSKFPTVQQLYDMTFTHYRVSLKTKEKHNYCFKLAIAPYADKTIDKVTSADIQLSLNEYAKTHTAKETSRVMTVWKRIYDVAALNNVNVINRTAGIRLTDVKCIKPKSRKKDISRSDLETFCDTLLEYNCASLEGGYRCKAVYYAIRIMQYCGLRPAETFALMKSDIHLSAGYISITKASHSTETSMLEISDTKTEKSVRNVPIPEPLKPILIECLEWSRNEILLSDYHGNLLDIDDVGTLVRNVRIRAKVDFNLYMLRHQFSTDLLTQGTAPNLVRDLMGHESSTMTLDYATSRSEDLVKAINDRKFS